jgi:hypothetical protein
MVKNILLKLTKTLFILLCSYLIMLSVVFSIPNSLIETHVHNGVNIIQKEGLWPKYFFNNSSGGQLDNFTDKVMLKETVTSEPEFSPLKSAMFMGGYARYWHGYQVILRPILILFSYSSIRFLNTFIIFGMFCWCLILFNNRIGRLASIAFFLSMMSIKLFIVPMSMQFTNLVLLSLLLIIITSYILPPKKDLTESDYLKEYRLFFCIGSLTSFFDLLTVPLLPVGMVLLFIIMWHYKSCQRVISIKQEIKYLLVWLVGYALTWISKWVLADGLYNFHVISNGVNQVIYRIGGTYSAAEGGKQASRFLAFSYNLKMLFAPFDKTKVMVLGCIIIIGWLVIKHYYRRTAINTNFVRSILFIAVLPWIWYICIPNHSQLHAWFTYRSQAYAVAGFIYVMLYYIDWKKLGDKIGYKKLF